MGWGVWSEEGAGPNQAEYNSKAQEKNAVLGTAFKAPLLSEPVG